MMATLCCKQIIRDNWTHEAKFNVTLIKWSARDPGRNKILKVLTRVLFSNFLLEKGGTREVEDARGEE